MERKEMGFKKVNIKFLKENNYFYLDFQLEIMNNQKRNLKKKLKY